MSRSVLVDTDTASDDAVALIMALRSDRVTVKAITTVAGNVGVEQATSNALYTAELCAADVPVFTGTAKPLSRPLQTAQWFHGRHGLGDQGYRPAKRQPEQEQAVEAIIRLVKETAGLEIITLGPLTNLALALSREPGIVAQVSRCVVMGGAPCCEGNVTPAAEFNIWVDPEAARIVFRSGLRIELIGWQLSRGRAVINEADIRTIESHGTPWSRFAIRSNSIAMDAYRKQTGEIGISLPDPVAMGILLDPSLSLEASDQLVEVETGSELTRGMTVVDRLDVAADERNREVWSQALASGAKASICWRLDVERWKAYLFDSLGPAPSSAVTRASM